VKGTKEHKAAVDVIHRSYGSDKFSSAVRRYLETYGVPTEWGTLLLLLDYKEDEILAEAIKKLKDLAPKRTPVEKQGLRNKLEILTLTGKSSRTTSVAEAALKELWNVSWPKGRKRSISSTEARTSTGPSTR